MDVPLVPLTVIVAGCSCCSSSLVPPLCTGREICICVTAAIRFIFPMCTLYSELSDVCSPVIQVSLHLWNLLVVFEAIPLHLHLPFCLVHYNFEGFSCKCEPTTWFSNVTFYFIANTIYPFDCWKWSITYRRRFYTYCGKPAFLLFHQAINLRPSDSAIYNSYGSCNIL